MPAVRRQDRDRCDLRVPVAPTECGDTRLGRMEKRVQVKICGIRSERDLRVAVDAGPDAVGFICGITHLSEDALTPAAAKDLSAKVALLTTRAVTRVLVTHLEDAEAILKLAAFVEVDAIQVHGLVDRDNLRKVYAGKDNREVLRAVHVTDESVFADVEDVVDYCDVILLDSRTPRRLGGTGRTHNWDISKKIVETQATRGKKVTLAGGLAHTNIDKAITLVQPYGVDVNTGVDDENGNKSATLCAAFVEAANPGEPVNP
ncbi:phosphoribosylanthranilate isomerase [Nocardia sp. NPDC058705]|uniref:phosphoribosylanthranilate isomerase n=1 Tax=Nocardia sp. NPDC058705 TaxID=3346609 RepID=UPI0036CF1867